MSELPLIIEPDDEPDCGQILVDGRVAGRECRFRLDTGAATSSLVRDDFTQAFARTGTTSGSGVFTSGESDLVEVPELVFGPIVHYGVRLGLGGAQNLLGMDLLKDHVLHFHLGRRMVAVDADGEAATLPLFMPGTAHPYVDVALGPVTASAVWDSGAGITVVDEDFRRRNAGLFTPAAPSVGIDGSGTQMQTPTWTMCATTIGGVRFSPHRAAAVDLSGMNATIERPMDLILGFPALNQADWLFDFPARRWSVSPR